MSFRRLLLRSAFTTTALTRVLGFAVLAGVGATSAQAQQALPSGGTVASGSAAINSGASQVTIDQTSSKAIINWTGFSVGAGNSVVFNQPDAGSATLNRVTGTASSTIAGQISANGTVYLVNPNGIAITSTGSVQTGGGFVASTLNLTDQAFNAGTLAFTGNGASGRVANAGSISAGQGAYVALLGGTISNSGTITVPLGRVGLGSGERITLDLNGDGFMAVAVPTAAIAGDNAALIEVAGSIAASGGRVEISAATARSAVRNIVNLGDALSADSAVRDGGAIRLLSARGTASARTASTAPQPARAAIGFTGTVNTDSATGNGGSIVLLGGAAGTVTASGTLSARATGPAGNGGLVETSGASVNFAGLTIDTSSLGGTTGTWLVDPIDLTVDAAAAATIAANLATSNVTLQTTATTASGPGVQTTGNGDIIVNSAIGWSSGNALSLLAYNNIALNAAITAPNGGLVLTAGNGVANSGAISAPAAVNVGTFNLTNGAWSQNSATLPAFSATDFRFNPATATFLRVTGGTGASASPYTIADVYGLQGIASSTLLAQNFALANDIAASGTAKWNNGAGFVPIGTDGNTYFSGIFDGQFHVIAGLSIKRPSANNVGLFGFAKGGLRNVSLTNVSIEGNSGVGGLVGDIDGGAITQVSVTGSVTGNSFVGGLLGLINVASLSNSYSSANVSGNTWVGGLVGQAYSGSIISNVYATGSVTGTGSSNDSIGGLIGLAKGSISSAYASGKVTGITNVGGLVGVLNSGSIANSYWDSYSTGQASAVGLIYVGGTLTNVTTVTSDPSQSAAANYAYNASAYANLTAGAASVGTATPSGFVFMPGNSTRPFLAFEVPTSFTTTTVGGNLLITNSHQLQLIGYDNTRLSTNYTLANDINLAETGAVVAGTPGSYAGMWAGTGWMPIGTDGAGAVLNGGNGFTGVFDGHFHVIAKLSINRSVSYVGLFGELDGGIRNVSLADVSIQLGLSSVGGLIGDSSGGIITNVSVTGSVAGSSDVGGLVGSLYNGGSINNSYSSAIVSAPNYAGGLLGFQAYGFLSNVYATGAVNGNTNAGGLIGAERSGTIASAYASGKVTGSSDVGGLIGYLVGGSVANSYWDSYSTGQSAAIGLLSSAGTLTNVTSVTSDPSQSAAANYAYKASAYTNLTAGAASVGTSTPSGFVYVAGNSTRPFLAFEVPTSFTAATDASGRLVLNNSHQLQLIGYNAATNAASYSLGRNIDLAETGAVVVGTPGSYAGMWAGTGWVPLGTDGAGLVWNGSGYSTIGTITSGIYGFSGALNGGGYALTNLTIKRAAAKFVGLFGVASGALSNVTVTGSVTGLNGVGGLAGLLYSGGSISAATSAVNVAGNNAVGGLVGNLSSGTSITASSASGTAAGVNDVGGLVGYASGSSIIRSFATGAASGTNYVGGLVGYQYNTSIANNYATGSATGTFGIGGLIGTLNGGSLTNSYSVGAVSGSGQTGGLIGALNGAPVTSSYWDINTSGQPASAGGTGRTTAQLQDSVNYAVNYPGWDFTAIWIPPTAGTYPKLKP